MGMIPLSLLRTLLCLEKHQSKNSPEGFSDYGEELTEGKLDGRNDGVTDGAVVNVGVSDGGKEMVGAAETDGCNSSPHSQSSMNENKNIHEKGSSSPFNPSSSSFLHVTGGCPPGKMTRPLGFLTRSEPPQTGQLRSVHSLGEGSK